MHTEIQYGLLLEKHEKYETMRVDARVVAWEPGKDYPRNVPLDTIDLPKHLRQNYLAGLGLYGFVGSDGEYLGFDPEYRDAYIVTFQTASRMAVTLGRIQKYIERERARQPGDYYMALAQALKLDFYCERTNKVARSNFADNDYVLGTIFEGRNRFRLLIEEAVKENERDEHSGVRLANLAAV